MAYNEKCNLNLSKRMPTLESFQTGAISPSNPITDPERGHLAMTLRRMSAAEQPVSHPLNSLQPE